MGMKRLFLLITAAILFLSGLYFVVGSQTSALSGSNFQAGRIIDDAVFFNGNAMSVSQIQQFLNAKVPSCDTWGTKAYGSTTRAAYGTSKGYPPPYTCLKDFKQNIPNRSPEDQLCKGITGGSGRTAAQIIDAVSRSCGISQRVLIVLLQKEQSLLTDDWPWGIQYRSATGYGCPDTAPCDSQYYGFFNQVYMAARQYKYYAKYPNSFNHVAKRTNYILYNPNTACGGSNVYIQNQATAGLYNYTPYQPNASALNNLYGTGNNCSAYGNRNFWRLYNDWFGSTLKTYNVVPVIYDNSTDTSGEVATIGFKLTGKPSSNVTLDLQNNSIYHTASTLKITITPENWNTPTRNTVTLKGKNTAQTGSVTVNLLTGNLTSSDSRFSLSANYTPNVPVLHQDLSNEVYRLYDTTTGSHLFTGSEVERDTLVTQGWRDEGIGFYGCAAGNVTLARVHKDRDYKLLPYGSSEYNTHINNGYALQSLVTTTSGLAKKTLHVKYRASSQSTLYTLSSTEGDSAGFATAETMFVCEQNITPVFRLYDGRNSNHFYTVSTSERNSSYEKYGLRYEGVGFYLTNGGTLPVYRLYHSRQGDHFYTASISEKNSAINGGYKYEGIGFMLNTSDQTDVYRLYNGSIGNHFYTTSANEKSSVVNAGYRYEGVGFTAY